MKMSNKNFYKQVNVKKLTKAVLFLTGASVLIGGVLGYTIGVNMQPQKIYAQNSEQLEVIEQKEILEEYKITAYCPCVKCCEKWADGYTATGTKATAGRTVAVDPELIPYGSKVIIDGMEYIAEDCGGAIKGNRIDIFFDTHEEALEFGVQYKEVKVIERGKEIGEDKN